MHTKIKSLFFASIIAVSALINVVSPTIAMAKTNVEMSPREQAISYSYYFAVLECFGGNRMQPRIAADAALTPQQWFNNEGGGDKQVAVGHLIDTEDGERSCENLITSALILWGYAGDFTKALTDFGYSLDSDGRYNRPSSLQDRFRNAIKTKVYAGNSPVLSAPALYQRALFSFVNGCKAASIGEWEKITDGQRNLVTGTDNHYRVTIVAPAADGKSTTKIDYLYKAEKDKDTAITMFEKDGGGRESDQCQTLAANTARYAAAYQSYADDVLESGGTLDQASPTSNNPGDAETCNLANIGWLVCPVALFLAGVTDSAYALVEKLLVFRYSENPLDTSSANPVYTIWSNVRNLANIAFIFAFFAIIFSQATSIGIGSYGIKKMLPRLVVAAIMVNLSYYICVFAVDISNIVGAGIDGIIRAPFANGGGISSDSTTAAGTWTGIITTVLAVGVVGAAVASVTGVGALAAALPFLVIALFAILTALVILIARQAILILLIIVAPLAFVAYILPNTESMFDKWRKLFITMLIFYPLVAIIFSGAAVAASILRITSNGGGFDDQLIKVMSLAVQAFPLFALPFILKFSGGVLGRIGGMVNNPNKGPFDTLRKRAEGKRDTVIATARQDALKKPAPNYAGKRFAKQRTALSKRNIFSSKNAAQAAVDRNRALEEAKSGQARAETEYFAGRVGTDEAYANRMAGGNRFRPADPANLARLSGRANEAIIKLNNEEVGAHNLNLNRNGAALAAEGIGMTADNRIVDIKSGAALDPTSGAFTARLAKYGLQDSIKNGRFDVETEAALKYATQNQLPATANGVKSLASTMAATGILTADSARDMVDNLNVDVETKSFIAAHINTEARKAGLSHLSYNTVNAATGKFDIGGQFGGIDNVVKRLMQNGASSLTKEMYADKEFGPRLARAVVQLQTTSPETFDAELVKMDERKMENLIKAQQAGIAAGTLPPTHTVPTMDQLRERRVAAVEKYGLTD